MPEPDRPNVLWIFSDQHRACAMSCAGDANIETPNLDRLAAEGVRATGAYANTPLCSPFRASLLTGQYATTHGVVSNHRPLLPRQPVLAEVMRNAGYHTSYMGKWHISGGCFGHHFVSPWFRPGWDDWLGWENSNVHFDFEYAVGTSPRIHRAEGFMTDWLTDRTLDWLREAPHDRPWFHVMSTEPPHNPNVAPEPYMAAYADRPLQLRPNVPAEHPRSDVFDRRLRGYYAQIKNIDDNVGRLLAALERTGQLDNTIVMYLSDHGDLMGSHGFTDKERPEQESANIPLLVRHPESVPAGQVCDALIGGVDLMPTLLSLLGVACPTTVEGVDCSAALRGQDTTGAGRVYMQYEHCIFPENPALPWRALRRGRWHYASWLAEGTAQLHDLQADPYQLTNLADTPEHQATRQSLEAEMRRIAADLGDDFFERTAR